MSEGPRKVSIIIPAYNEAAAISGVLDAVLRADTSPYAKEIIVADDGSSDGTAVLLEQAAAGSGIKVVTHPVNRGKAAAIRSALKIATGDIILIQDADLEYSPGDYRRLLLPFADSGIQAVYGSRFLNKQWPENMRAANWIANRVFTLLVNLLYGAAITDEGTGYKLFRRETVGSLNIACSGFEFCPEVTAKLLKNGVRIVEVPVAYRARSRKEGKKPTFLDGLKVIWTIIKFRFRD